MNDYLKNIKIIENDEYNNYLTNNNFASYRALNHFVMDNTKKMYENEKSLKEIVATSINDQYIIFDNETIEINNDNIDNKIVISKKRTLEAASYYKGKKIAVLNFANNHSIGGSPWSAGAQEESLCRCSTLFPCLEAKKEDYYDYHRYLFENNKLDHLGNDDIIYTPNVCVFKTDESAPKIIEEDKRFFVDVISCAAPELLGIESEEEIEKVLRKRIVKILQVAKKEKVEVLILGAFGCGAFHNPPTLVAKIFKEELNNYHFDIVEFAIFCRGDNTSNYDIFKDYFEK